MALNQFIRRTSPAGACGPAGAPPPVAELEQKNVLWIANGPTLSFEGGPTFTPDQKVVVAPNLEHDFAGVVSVQVGNYTLSGSPGDGTKCLVNRATAKSWYIRWHEGEWLTLPYEAELPEFGRGRPDDAGPLEEIIGLWYSGLGSTFSMHKLSGGEDGSVFICQDRFEYGARIDCWVGDLHYVRRPGKRNILKVYQHGALTYQLHWSRRLLYRGWYQLIVNHEAGPPSLLKRFLWKFSSRPVRWLLLLMTFVFVPALLPLALASWAFAVFGSLPPADYFWASDPE